MTTTIKIPPRRPQIHRLKIWPEHIKEVSGGRRFEFRRDDRDFRPGDFVIFDEWEPTAEGREVRIDQWGQHFERIGPHGPLGEYTGLVFGPVEITSITRSICIPEGWCGLAFIALARADGFPVGLGQKLQQLAEGA
jgi:hypothetical protein